MGISVLKNVKTYYRGHDLSGDMNNCTLTNSVELLDRTCFGSTFRKRKSGLKDYEVSMSGYWNTSGGRAGNTYGKIDPIAHTAIGGSSDVLSVLPDGTGLGNIAYFGKSVAGEYSPSGSIGELFAYNFTAYGDGNLLRGKVMEAGILTTESDDHIRAFGAASTLKNLYAAVHVLGTSQGAAGASVKIKIQRSTTTDFAVVDSTCMTFILTTADSGQGRFGTTKVESSGTAYSYRAHTSQLGSSDKKFNVRIILSQQ